MSDKYVAPSGSGGSNSNSGLGTGTPYLTWRKGLENVSAGDTVWIMPGTYTEHISSADFTIPSGTSFANAVTVRALTPGTVILAPTTDSAIKLNGSERYMIWRDFTINGASCSDDGIDIGGDNTTGPGFIRFLNVEVKNIPSPDKQGILVWGGPGSCEFLNVHSHHHSGDDNQSGHGIYLSRPNCLIDGGEYDHNNSFGIHVYANGASEDNSNTITRNVNVHENDQGMVTTGGTNLKTYNNRSWGNAGSGIFAEFGNTSSGIQLYNNASYGNGSDGIRVGANQTACVLTNNLSYGNSGTPIVDVGTGTIQTTNRITDPSWYDAPNHDFHLNAGSPAINSGSDLSSIFTTDAEGHVRPPGFWDQGPYEYAAVGPPTGNSRRLIASDAFSGGSQIALAGNWQQLNAATITMYKTAAGYVAGSPGSTTVNGAVRWTADAFTNDHYSSLQLQSLTDTIDGSSFIGVAVRCSGDINAGRDMYFVAVYTISGVTSTFLGKNIDGAETGLGTRTDIVWSANDRIELEAVGPIISVMKSGSVLFSVSDSSLQGGAPGIIGGGTLDSLGDNWEGGNLNDTSTSIPAQKGRRFTFLKLRG